MWLPRKRITLSVKKSRQKVTKFLLTNNICRLEIFADFFFTNHPYFLFLAILIFSPFLSMQHLWDQNGIKREHENSLVSVSTLIFLNNVWV